MFSTIVKETVIPYLSTRTKSLVTEKDRDIVVFGLYNLKVRSSELGFRTKPTLI
jgi:hypothetical protein